MSTRLTLSCLLLPIAAAAQQVADTSYRPRVAEPAYQAGTGPLVFLDEAHHNFHRVDGRYAPFVKLLERDGYVVRPNRARFSLATLESARVLVIANAIAAQNDGTNAWVLPNPSAFADDEIAAVRDWVRAGGSLLLIADHMPFAGAADKLGAAFGVVFGNGFVFDSSNNSMLRFRRADGSLGVTPITNGRNPSERIDSVTAFTGSAFRVASGAPLMTLGPGTSLLLPIRAWQFNDSTPRIRTESMLQGTHFPYGNGRVVVLGEAAMLSAQVAGAQRLPMGLNHPEAPQNAQFALNVMHWLSRLY